MKVYSKQCGKINSVFIVFSPSLLDKLKQSTETVSQKLSVEEGEKGSV